MGEADAVTAISGGSNIAGAISISRTPHTEKHGDVNGEATAWASLRESDPASPEEQRLMGNLGYLLARNPRGEDTTSGEGNSIANGLQATPRAHSPRRVTARRPTPRSSPAFL